VKSTKHESRHYAIFCGSVTFTVLLMLQDSNTAGINSEGSSAKPQITSTSLDWRITLRYVTIRSAVNSPKSKRLVMVAAEPARI